jgi:hypothetical protein
MTCNRRAIGEKNINGIAPSEEISALEEEYQAKRKIASHSRPSSVTVRYMAASSGR